MLFFIISLHLPFFLWFFRIINRLRVLLLLLLFGNILALFRRILNNFQGFFPNHGIKQITHFVFGPCIVADDTRNRRFARHAVSSKVPWRLCFAAAPILQRYTRRFGDDRFLHMRSSRISYVCIILILLRADT